MRCHDLYHWPLTKCVLTSHAKVIIMLQDMPIAGFMKRQIVSLSPGQTLKDARAILETHDFHHIPVLKDDILVGILSYTDYIRELEHHFRQAAPGDSADQWMERTTIEAIMTTSLLTLSPDSTLRAAIRMFNTHTFHALPVTDVEGHLLGMLTTTDVMKAIEKHS